MTLDQLTLRNFGLFRGTQVLNLTPVARNGKVRPIVLVGGINGGGKTTLFDAIQLALYGPRARCSKRAQLTYHDFLLESIHQGVSPAEGAGVALSFRYVSEGECSDYEVRRNWQLQEDKLRETLLVLKDGLPNNTLSANWPQLVEELIPLEISQLFFFDGEKIRALADDHSSGAALGAAIKALLGLDIVERLIADAVVLGTRLTGEAGTPEQRARWGELEGRVRECRREVETLHTDSAALENQLGRAVNEQRQAEEAFAAAGGKHWDDRDRHQKRVKELADQEKELEVQLVVWRRASCPWA